MDLIGRGICPKNPSPPRFLCAQGNAFAPIHCRAPAASGVMPVGWCNSCAPRYNRVQSPPRALPVGASVTEGVGTMSKCTTPLESAVPKNAPTTLLECALTQLQDLNSFRISTYEKVGVSPGAFAQLYEMSSWAWRACAGPTTLGRSGGQRISALLVGQFAWREESSLVMAPPRGAHFGLAPASPAELARASQRFAAVL